VSDAADQADGDPGPIIRCWCGEIGMYDELFDDSGLQDGCGGTGRVECFCGGDICICHHHGQSTECPGCDECPERDEYDDDWFDGDDEGGAA